MKIGARKHAIPVQYVGMASVNASAAAAALPSCASVVCRPLTLVHLALAALLLARRRGAWWRVDAVVVVVAVTLAAYMASIEELPESCPLSVSLVTQVFRMVAYAACPAERDTHRACREKVFLFYMAWVPMLTASVLAAMMWWRSLVASWPAQRRRSSAGCDGCDTAAGCDGCDTDAPRAVARSAPTAATAGTAGTAATAGTAGGAPAARRGRSGVPGVSYMSAHDLVVYHGRVTQRNVYNEATGKDHGYLPGPRFAAVERWLPTYGDGEGQ